MKLFRKIILLISVIILTLSFAGCSFVASTDNNGGDNANPSKQQSAWNSSAPAGVKLKNSLDFAKDVSFTGNHNVKYDTADKVLDNTKVDRSVVCLIVSYGNYMASGCGVIVDIDDGIDYGDNEDNIFYVITCHHVIDGVAGVSNSITAYVPDENGNNYDDSGYDQTFKFTGYIGGTVAEARTQAVSLVGGYKYADVAVLRLFVPDGVASKIVKAKIMDPSNKLKLGEDVFAIGNPNGAHPGRLSKGVIADIEENAEVEDIGAMTLIGLDMNTYPGNSGGGLFNMYGELVGITNSGEAVEVYTTSGSTATVTSTLNSAIPLKTTDDKSTDLGVVNITKQLIGSYGDYNYGYISGKRIPFGFTVGTQNGKVVITSVVSRSMAEQSGISVYDVIESVQVNGGERKTVLTVSDLASVLDNINIDDTVSINFLRTSGGNRQKSFTVSLKAYQYFFCNTENYTGIQAN